VLVVLLAISTLAAALAPVPEEDEQAEEERPVATEPQRHAPAARLVRATIDARTRRLETVLVQLGEQLALRVIARAPDQVEIAELDRVDDVSPGTPARFDLLPFRPGTHDVRLLEAARTIGRIRVVDREQRASGRAADRGGEGANRRARPERSRR
jgi:hypothetical protein